MPFLLAPVALVGALCLLDLLLTLGVIRRLRAHTLQLQSLRDSADLGGHLPLAGSAVGEFAATTTEGEPVSRELPGETLVAFFSTDCEPCREKLPVFVEHAQEQRWARDQILAVISGQTEQTAEMAEALGLVARVVVEQDMGPLTEAFQVRAFPAFCLVDTLGTVLAADLDYAHLPVAARA